MYRVSGLVGLSSKPPLGSLSGSQCEAPLLTQLPGDSTLPNQQALGSGAEKLPSGSHPRPASARALHHQHRFRGRSAKSHHVPGCRGLSRERASRTTDPRGASGHPQGSAHILLISAAQILAKTHGYLIQCDGSECNESGRESEGSRRKPRQAGGQRTALPLGNPQGRVSNR